MFKGVHWRAGRCAFYSADEGLEHLGAHAVSDETCDLQMCFFPMKQSITIEHIRCQLLFFTFDRQNMFFCRGAQVLDIDLEELPDIFDVLDDGDGEITTEEFLWLSSLHNLELLFLLIWYKVLQYSVIHNPIFGNERVSETSLGKLLFILIFLSRVRFDCILNAMLWTCFGWFHGRFSIRAGFAWASHACRVWPWVVICFAAPRGTNSSTHVSMKCEIAAGQNYLMSTGQPTKWNTMKFNKGYDMKDGFLGSIQA